MHLLDVLSLSQYRPSLLGTLAAVSFLGIVLFSTGIFIRNRRSPIGRAYYALSVFTAVWVFGYALDLFSDNMATATFWTRVSFAGFCFIPPSLFFFITTFLKTRNRFRSVLALGFALSYGFFLTVIWTDWTVKGVIAYSWGHGIAFGPGRIFFLTFFLAFVTACIVQLTDAYQREPSRVMKKQVRILLFAFLVGVSGTSDFFLPEGLPFYPWAYLTALGSVLILSYAVLRYPHLFFVPSTAYDSIIHTMSDGLIVLDADCRIMAVNPALQELLRYEEEALIGRDVAELFPENEQPFLPGIIPGGETWKKQPRNLNTRMKTSSGELVPVNLARTVARDPSGGLLATVGIARDMRDAFRMQMEMEGLNQELRQKVREVEEKSQKLESSYRELQESRDTIVKVMNDRELTYQELVEANERLELLDRMKDQFLASVSHEFRSPLTSIRSFAEILFKYPDEPLETRQDFLAIIQSESDRLTRLINNCLDLSKIKSGKMAWKEEWVDPAQLVEDVLDTFQQQLRSKGYLTRVESTPQLPRVWIDKDRLVQVLHNLLTNAFRFTDTGGDITIRLDRFEGRRKQDPKEFVQVVVSDTGKGIPESELETIFAPFRQGGDPLTGKPSGTGLGLSICREIVEHYGGKIWAESEQGKGSRFTFTLPSRPFPRGESARDVSASRADKPPSHD